MPIIVLAVLLESRLPPVAFAWLGIIGGLFVIYLGIDTIRSTGRNTDKQLAIKNIKESTANVLWRATM